MNCRNKNIRNKFDYRKYQKKLLQGEINTKNSCIKLLKHESSQVVQKLQLLLSYVDFKHVVEVLKRSNRHKLVETEKNRPKEAIEFGTSLPWGEAQP